MQVWMSMAALLTLIWAVSDSPQTESGRLSLEGHYYRPFILKEIERKEAQFSYESLSDSEGYMELVLKPDAAKQQDGYLVHYDGLEQHQHYPFQLKSQGEQRFELRFKEAAPYEKAQLQVTQNDTVAQSLSLLLEDNEYVFTRRVFQPEGKAEWMGFPDLEHYLKYLHYAGSYKLIVNGGKNRKIELDYKGNVKGAEDLLDYYVLRQNNAGYDIVFFGQKADFPPETINKMGTVEMLTDIKGGYEYGDYYADKWIFRLIRK